MLSLYLFSHLSFVGKCNYCYISVLPESCTKHRTEVHILSGEVYAANAPWLGKSGSFGSC